MEKKNLKYLFFIITIFILYNCSDGYKLSESEIHHLKNNIIKKGSESSYIKLATYYENINSYGEILPYYLIMINKHKYNRGYDKVAEEIIKINNNGRFDITYLGKLNQGDRNFVLYYLNIGLKEEDIECIFLFEKIYRNGLGVKKDLIKADSLKIVYYKRMNR